jgi:group I intron endonuclease
MKGIYKITNPKGEIYVGLSKNILKRWESYKSRSGMSSTSSFKNSLIKYGYDNHIFEILEEVEGDNTELRQKEKFWISYFESNTKGLNDNRGGCGVGSHTEESKQKISQALKGKPKPQDFGEKRSKDFYTDEWKQKCRESSKGVSRGKGISKNKGRISPNKGKLGKKRTDKSKTKIGKANSKPKPEGFGELIRSKSNPQLVSKRFSKPINQYDIQGNLIREFKSILEALKGLNKQSNNSSITSCLKGRQKTAFGYIWKYKEK